MTACVVCGDPATSGLNLDAKCLELLAEDIATCARLHAELEGVLVRPTRPDEGGGKRATSVGIALDDAAVTARDHIRATLVGWVRVAQEERPLSPRGVGVAPGATSAANGRENHAHGPANGWPADTVPDMARWIGRNLTWYAGRPWVDEMARVFGETADEATAAVQPDRARRVPIGDCPERVIDDQGQDVGRCTGMLFALIRPADSLLPADIRCTAGDHRWTADQWHALGRLLRAMDEAAARRLAAVLDGTKGA